MKRKVILAYIFHIFLILLFSCAPLTFKNAWKNDNYHGIFKNVYILSALQDPVLKKFVEDEFVKQLKFHGTDAVAGYTHLQVYGMSDKESIAVAMKELDADALLITKWIKLEKDEIDVREKEYVIPNWYYDWYRFYSEGYGYISTPQYDDENYFIIIETSIYETKTETMIWFAQSASLLVVCGCQEIRYHIEEIINKLSSDKLIK